MSKNNFQIVVNTTDGKELCFEKAELKFFLKEHNEDYNKLRSFIKDGMWLCSCVSIQKPTMEIKEIGLIFTEFAKHEIFEEFDSEIVKMILNELS
jgi:hypothetical protein